MVGLATLFRFDGNWAAGSRLVPKLAANAQSNGDASRKQSFITDMFYAGKRSRFRGPAFTDMVYMKLLNRNSLWPPPAPIPQGTCPLPLLQKAWHGEGRHCTQKNSKQEIEQTALTITKALIKTTDCTCRAKKWNGTAKNVTRPHFQIRFVATGDHAARTKRRKSGIRRNACSDANSRAGRWKQGGEDEGRRRRGGIGDRQLLLSTSDAVYIQRNASGTTWRSTANCHWRRPIAAQVGRGRLASPDKLLNWRQIGPNDRRCPAPALPSIRQPPQPAASSV